MSRTFFVRLFAAVGLFVGGVVVGSFVTDRFDVHPFQAFENKAFSAMVERAEPGAVAVIVAPGARGAQVVRGVDVPAHSPVAVWWGVSAPLIAPVVCVATPVRGPVVAALVGLVRAVLVC